MIPKNSFRITRKRFFISGLFVLGVLFLSPVHTRAVSDINIPLSKINPYIDLVKSEVDSLKNKVESSLSSLTSSVLDAVREFITPESELTSTSLLNAYRDYVEEAPTSVKTVTVQGAQR